MPRVRQIYQTDLLYVGPTGARPATGALLASGLTTGTYGNYLAQISGTNFISQLFRVQKVDHNWNARLNDVNQFGELAAIDRVSLEPPTVGLSFNYYLSNFINENALGLTVNKAGDVTQVSCLSGILAATHDQKNYFVKTVTEGNDAADLNPATYDVISFGNGYIGSYAAQGSVGNFPTADVTVAALNAQMQSVTHALGATTPAVFQTDGTPVTGWGYILPTGLTSFNNAPLTANNGISVLRPGDVTLTLGLGAGDGFAAESDIKVQSFNVSANTNQEDISKLGTKYAYAKVPRFPVSATMTVNALVGDHQTGSLVEIVNNNKDFNPSINITKPGSPTVTICNFQLKGAKLESQDFSSSIGSNKSVNFTFTSQIGGPNDSTHGLFLSGIVS